MLGVGSLTLIVSGSIGPDLRSEKGHIRREAKTGRFSPIIAQVRRPELHRMTDLSYKKEIKR